jgi:hypothetical protein
VKSQASWIFEWRFLTAFAMVLLTVNRQCSLDERFSGVSLRTSLSRTPAWSFVSDPRARSVLYGLLLQALTRISLSKAAIGKTGFV